MRVPNHIAIILDGNGRWAKSKGMPRNYGHVKGCENLEDICEVAKELGVKYLTVYAFSTENWKRTEEEVGYLMGLIRRHLRAEFDFYKKKGIKIKHIGDIDGLPDDVRVEIIKASEETAHFTGMTVVLAINYGGRNEIVRGVKKMIADGTSADDITEDKLCKSFDIPDLPDVDLMIRTGGELRLSNFLLWHAAYAELLFTDTLWPDYNKEEFLSDIEKFQHRTRRFGGVLNP